MPISNELVNNLKYSKGNEILAMGWSLKDKHLDGEVYLFTTKGQIKGKKYENIKILDPKEIHEFIMNSENDNILPEKAIRWREVLMEISK